MVRAGCSRNYINKVIVAILKSAGVNVVDSISQTSVTHILREGYIAAQIQLGYEMQQTGTMTFSQMEQITIVSIMYLDVFILWLKTTTNHQIVVQDAELQDFLE